MAIRAKPSLSSLKTTEMKIVPEIEPDFKPRIIVIGAGGAGGNAVNNMIRSKLEGVDFVIANTDAQALGQALCAERLHLGLNVTQGLGAGSSPEVGRAAAEESIDDIVAMIEGTHMLFITAGMGGGTGTGAAPVIAHTARELGILTVGVVTKPFHFEGAHRMRTAERGIEELQQCVDTLIVIPNQNLFRVANEKTTFADAFKMADDVLYSGVRSITDLMIMPGLINLDFADIRTIMTEMGKAMMGTGEAEGENRALRAAEAAIANPLLDDVSMKGAKGVLISITGGMDMTLFEVDEAANDIRDKVEADANIIFGSTFDERLNGRIRVSVVATGIDQEYTPNILSSGPQSKDSFNFKKPQDQDFSEQTSDFMEDPTIALEPIEDQAARSAQENIESENSIEFNEEDSISLGSDLGAYQSQVTTKRSGFFERFSRSFKTEKPAARLQAQQPALRVRTSSPASNFESPKESDVSDIPAFLRKKGK
ncbi:MAG: cell division protein FtsZ [Alphaproteobacteria bacterium]|nr:cell division protein FtsZ [Alphaproteobacteria bacterium]